MKHAKVFDTSYKNAYVRAPPNWTPNTTNFSKVSDSIYYIYNLSDPNILFNDPKVEDIYRIPEPKFWNRHVVGFHQSQSTEYEFRDGNPYAERVLDQYGLNGTGEFKINKI